MRCSVVYNDGNYASANAQKKTLIIFFQLISHHIHSLPTPLHHTSLHLTIPFTPFHPTLLYPTQLHFTSPYSTPPHTRLPLDLMAYILPQIVNPEHAVKFIDTNLNDGGKLALRVKVGQLYNSYVGLPTGHYSLDLSQMDQRNGGRRLGAISVSEAKVARAAGANTSQKGAWRERD